MALVRLFQGTTTEKNSQGLITSITFFGTKADCDTWLAGHAVGTTYDSNGRFDGATVEQYSAGLYLLTARYTNVNGASGSTSQVVPPDYSYGEFSASLDGSMLSTPLEQHPSYLKNWNNYLIARYAIGGSAPSVPAWWSTAGAADVIPAADQDDFRWNDSSSLPLENGYVWIVLKNPTMPGVTSYDVALYTQTESARYRSYSAAAAAVAAKLNKVVSAPSVNPGFTGGSWKCDRATVAWTGDYWLATLTYTYSPDGWNSTLYPSS